MQYIFKVTRAEKDASANRSAISPASAGINLGDVLTAAVPRIRELSPSTLDNVVRCFENVHFDQHENILVEGDPGEEAFVLLVGKVQIAINGKVIRMLSKPGTLLGEKALFDDKHSVGATVTAVDGEASLMRLRQADFRSALSRVNARP